MTGGRPDDEAIAELLRAVGCEIDVAGVEVEAREDRWLVRLPGERLAWLPANPAGAARLDVERRVLGLIAAQCGFEVPRVLAELPGGGDLRAMVPGMREPWRLAERLGSDAALARRVGGALGDMLARQHMRITEAETRGWLRRTVSWPEPADWMHARLPEVIADAALLTRIDEIIGWWETEATDPVDLVLIHGDLGLHNIAFDEAVGEVRGLFDYDGAAWADRHYDFRYLDFDLGRSGLIEAAIGAYEQSTGVELDRARIALLNAVSAICFLANRHGVAPDVRWCGRTLEEDLGWVRWAIGRAGR